MKLASLSLQSFRAFRDASVQLERGTLLIGANDVGKSSILDAIRFILTDPNEGGPRWQYDETRRRVGTQKRRCRSPST